MLRAGVQPAAVVAVIAAEAQRLVRRLCPQCKEPYQPTNLELSEVGLSKQDLGKAAHGTIFRPREGGCELCNGLGYKGRAGIYELMPVEEPIKRLILARADSGTIRAEAQRLGMRTIKEDGALKVLSGMTSIAEVVRVTADGLDLVLD